MDGNGAFVVGSNISVDDGEFIRCPFNSTHRVLAQRFPYHFVKCKQNYPGVEVTHCPYNAKHCLRKDELQDHLVVCPQRSRIDPVIVAMPGQNSAIRSKPPQSMVDDSFSVAAEAPMPPQPPPPVEQVSTTENNEKQAEEKQPPYVSFLHRAMSGELLRQSLNEVAASHPSELK